jgi:hypothetical protein
MDEPDYERALTCAMRLLAMIDADPGTPKHVLLSRLVFEILAMSRS